MFDHLLSLLIKSLSIAVVKILNDVCQASLFKVLPKAIWKDEEDSLKEEVQWNVPVVAVIDKVIF